MKKYFLLLILSTTVLFAQKPSADSRYKEVAGNYGSSDGICLFDDGTFMLYGYATIVFGSYNFEKDYMNFYPDKQELFMIYAAHNPEIRNSARLFFNGFGRDKTVIQFDEEKPRPVFNEDANCFDSPYIFESNKKPSVIRLSDFQDEKWQQLKFMIPKAYNDFAIFYNQPSRYEENFSGTVRKEDHTAVLNISLVSRDFKKNRADKNNSNWQEILQMKSEYDLTKKKDGKTVFFNKHYNMFPDPDSSAYRFDEKSNQFITKNPQNNDAYYRDNPYQDNRSIRKYGKLESESGVDFSADVKNISSESLFFTVCGEGSEKSYHYKGLNNYNDKSETRQLQQTAPLKPIAPPAPLSK